MDVVFTVLNFVWDGFLGNMFDWFLGVLAFWGLLDLYMVFRMAKAGKIDKTASLWNWFNLKWCICSQTELVAEKLPFITKDLSEVVGVKKDDGKIT